MNIGKFGIPLQPIIATLTDNCWLKHNKRAGISQRRLPIASIFIEVKLVQVLPWFCIVCTRKGMKGGINSYAQIPTLKISD
jgi:hypothetical protein